MVECEAILNSCPLTVDTISDVNKNGGGEESSTQQMSFGQGGKRNFCVNSSSDRNGMTGNETLKLVMWLS